MFGYGDLDILTASESGDLSGSGCSRDADRLQAGDARGEARAGAGAVGRPRRMPLRRSAETPRVGRRRDRAATRRGRARPPPPAPPPPRPRAPMTGRRVHDGRSRSLADLRDRGAISARGVRGQEGGAARPALSGPPGRAPRTMSAVTGPHRALAAVQSTRLTIDDHPDRDLPAGRVPGPRVHPRLRRLPAGRRDGQDVRPADAQPDRPFRPARRAAARDLGARRRVRVRLGEADAGQPVEPARRPQRRGPRRAGRAGRRTW